MSQEEIVNNEEEIIEEEESEESTEEETSGEDESQDEDLETQLKELKEKNEKLEKLIVKHKKTSKVEKPTSKTDSELSQSDLYALIKADVHEEDISEVAEYAALKKISVKDALQSGVVKAILREKTEIRNTNKVANTGTTRKAATEVDADTLVERAKEGKLPDSKSDMEKLAFKVLGIKE